MDGEMEDELMLMDDLNKGEFNKLNYKQKSEIFPPKNSGSRTIIPLLLFDELDVTIRFTLFIAAFAALYLYDYTWSSQELPLVYIGLNMVTTLSRMSFFGGFFSYALSFLFGSVVGICILIILTYIVGHSSHPITYTQITGTFTCVHSPLTNTTTAVPVTVPLVGEVGDPNTVLLAVLLFICTFLILQFGRSNAWIKGAVITLNLYAAIWFLGMKTEAYPVPDNRQFFIYLRTTVIGICFFLVCLLLPLPKLFPTFVPQPRFSTSTMMVALRKSQADFTEVFTSMSLHFRHLLVNRNVDHKHFSVKKKETYSEFIKYQNVATVPSSSKLLMREKLESIIQTILKMKFLEKESTRWEAFWWTLPFPHCIGGSSMKEYLTKFHVAVIHARMMVRALDDIQFLFDDTSVFSDNSEEIDSVLELSEKYIKRSFLQEQNFERCLSKGNILGCCNEGNFFGDEDLEEKDLANRLFQLLESERSVLDLASLEEILDDLHDSKSKISKSLPLSFPRLFFIMNYLVIIRISKSLEDLCHNYHYNGQKEPQVVVELSKNCITHILEYPIRLCRWFTDYFFYLYIDMKDFFLSIFCRKKSPSKQLIAYFVTQIRSILSSFLVASSITVAFLFIFIEYFRTNVPSTITIIITIVSAVEPQNPGTAILRSIARLGGTTLGISMSYLVLALNSSDDKRAVYIASIVFAFVGRYLMGKEKFADLAQTFLTTSWIILYSGNFDLPSNLLLASVAARGIAVGIGIAIAFGALYLWPIAPNLQLRYNIIHLLCLKTTNYLKRVLTSLPSDYQQKTEEEYAHQSKEFTQKWLRRLKKMLTNINFQYELAIEAKEEFHIFSYDFPYHHFNQFIHLERNLIGDIFWMDMIIYYVHQHNLNRNPPQELIDAKTQFFQVAEFSLNEIGRKVYSNEISPFMVEYHLRKSFYQYIEALKSLFGEAKDGQKVVQIIRMYALVYTFALFVDGMAKLDKKAEVISAYNRARKPGGIPLCF